MTWYLKQKRHSPSHVFLNQENTGLTIVSEAGNEQIFELVSKARENQVYDMISEAREKYVYDMISEATKI